MDRIKGRASTVLWLVVMVFAIGVTASCQRDEGRTPESQVITEPSRVTIEQVQQWIADGGPFVILDSRSEGAWEADDTRAVGAIRVPPDDVESRLSEIPRNQRILVYCT